MDDPGTCQRRRFAQVIVMAGASCTGKSTLTERLLCGDLPDLGIALGFETTADYHVLHGSDWNGIEAARSDKVLLQYDLTADTPFAKQGEVTPGALDLLARARSITLLTVWERPDELERRLERRFDDRGGFPYTVARTLIKGRPRRAWRSVRRLRQRRRLFSQPDQLWVLYQRWFSSCARLPAAEHWVIRSMSPDEVTKLPKPLPDAPFWRS